MLFCDYFMCIPFINASFLFLCVFYIYYLKISNDSIVWLELEVNVHDKVQEIEWFWMAYYKFINKSQKFERKVKRVDYDQQIAWLINQYDAKHLNPFTFTEIF